MKARLLVILALGTAVALLPALAAAQQPASPTIQMPDPGGTVQLYAGCNNIALSFPDGTPSETVVQAVTPAGVVQSMWRHDAAQSRFEGYSPAAPQASDLLTVNLMDAVWLCIRMPSAAVLSEEDAGSTVQLQVGETMDVVLAGNPTTGFTWETEALDASILKQLGEPDYVAESDLIGAGGTFTFRFQAVGSGQAALRLIYHRPWETDVPPEETFEVTVVVQ